MVIFQLVLVLLFVGAILTALSERLTTPYPAVLAIAGAALAALPIGGTVTLDPELALALFVAPTLLDAAYDSSPRDLRNAWLPVGGLVLAAVALTVLATALVARTLVPGMPWAVAITLGAIVAPPDASAATAILRAVRPPYRVLTVLNGESLLNDASALLIYRLAVGVVGGASLSYWSTGWLLIVSCAGSILAGALLARGYVAFTRPIHDPTISIVLQFVGTFAVWIIATRGGLSPVLTTFAYGVALSRLATAEGDAVKRRASAAVWKVAVFVLNALAFILIGLQLRGVIGRAGDHLHHTITFAAAVLATVIVVRIIWVLGFTGFLRTLPEGLGIFRPSFRNSMVIGWCGMRGIVTIATALALPAGGTNGATFPNRDLVVAASYAVVFGTLVVQGLTLRPLMALLRIERDDTLELEIALARREIVRAGAGVAQRARLLELRRDRVIGDDAFHEVEEDLDWEAGGAARRPRESPG